MNFVKAVYLLYKTSFRKCYLDMVSNTEKYVDRVESVQRYFTWRAVGSKALSYQGRLVRLGLKSLESRRIKLNLTLFFSN